MDAQEGGPPGLPTHSIYAEAATNIVVYWVAVNYEHRLTSSWNNKVHLHLKSGPAFTAVLFGDEGFGGHASLVLLTGENQHHFEASVGGFLGIEAGQQFSNGRFGLPLLDIGYRLQYPSGGAFFRTKAGITGLGISLGYSF